MTHSGPQGRAKKPDPRSRPNQTAPQRRGMFFAGATERAEHGYRIEVLN
jgi:hypothetical protein